MNQQAHIELVSARTARARLVEGVLHVRMPAHWPPDQAESTLLKFQRWAARQRAKEAALPPVEPWDGRRWGEAELAAYVRRLNAETLQAPLIGVRIGQAKRTRLAQANTQTRVLTFSRYAVDGMPERALRYLVLHELAHLFEANHSARFWALVARHEPDYRRQRAIAQAHHARMTDRADRGLPLDTAAEPTLYPAANPTVAPATSAVPVPAPLPVQPAPEDLAEFHPFGPLFAFLREVSTELPSREPWRLAQDR